MTTTTPAGLGKRGAHLWRSIASEYELVDHEREVLLEACRTTDVLDKLHEIITRDGPVIAGSQGDRVHPAAIEARQQRVTLARLLAALRVPVAEVGAGAERGQRRGRPRGVYGVKV